MLYQRLQYYNHNEDQQEVCRTTLLSLWEAQCQGESDEVRKFFFVLPINNNNTRSYVRWAAVCKSTLGN